MPNYGGGLSGGLAGAGTGAAIGSIVPGIGTAVGAVGGGLIGALGGLFSGNKDKTRKMPTLLPEQREALLGILSQLGGQGGAGQNYGAAQGYLGRMLSGDQNAYSQWAAPHETQFQEQTLPRLAEQYAGLGGGLGGGVMGSSGFGQAIGGAATQFKSNLAGLYAQLQQAAAQNALGQYNSLAGLGLGTQGFQGAYQPGNLGFGGQAAQGIFQGIGQGAGMGLGGKLASLFPGPANAGPATGTNTNQGGP